MEAELPTAEGEQASRRHLLVLSIGIGELEEDSGDDNDDDVLGSKKGEDEIFTDSDTGGNTSTDTSSPCRSATATVNLNISEAASKKIEEEKELMLLKAATNIRMARAEPFTRRR